MSRPNVEQSRNLNASTAISISPRRDVEPPVGGSKAFLRVLRQIELYAPVDDLAVLLEGESGTGKSMLARYLHDWSARAHRPFVAIDVGTLDDELASTALFGNLPGAFTGARGRRLGCFVEADGGTLFIDEIGKASRRIQHCLLRAIEDQEITPVGADRPIHVDVRVVCASNVPLADMVERHEFAHDLFERIRSCTICIPPLRERRADIPLLTRSFVAHMAARRNYPKPPTVNDCLMTALTRALWPGNVRQLRGTLSCLLVEAASKEMLLVEDCHGDRSYLRSLAGRNAAQVSAEAVAKIVGAGGTVQDAASELGVSLPTAYRRLKASKIPLILAVTTEAPILAPRLSHPPKGGA